MEHHGKDTAPAYSTPPTKQLALHGRTAVDMTVAMQHPELSKDPKVVCSVMQSCKAFQQAVQLCGARNTVVKLSLESPLPHLRSFADWLVKHAPLVKSITANIDLINTTDYENDYIDCLPLARHVGEAHQLLQGALQSAAAGPCTAAVNIDGQQQHQQQQQQQQQRLHLEGFASNYVQDAGMMALLPAHSLTHLDLQLNSMGRVDNFEDSITAALAHLTKLRQLRLACDAEDEVVSGSCLLGLTQLAQLTFLALKGHWSGMDDVMANLLARPPPLQQLHLKLYGQYQALPAADLCNLSQLEELVVSPGLVALDAPAEPAAWTLPASLRCLHLHTPVDSSNLMRVLSLQQLRHLCFCVDFEDQRVLLHMAEQLPALQHVRLDYIELQAAVSTAPAWAQLRQLQELILDCCDEGPYSQQMGAILQGITAATQLTKLQVQAWVSVPEQDASGTVQFFPYSTALSPSLTRLTRLQDLCIKPTSHLEEDDLVALSVLTGLTRLVLAGVEIGDVAATALACNLQQLRHLDLCSCGLKGLVCCAAIGQLTQLTELNLYGNQGLTQRSLALLAGLTRLKCLNMLMDLEVADPVTPAVFWEFWGKLQQQQQQQQGL